MKSTRCILSIILGLLAGWLPLGAVTVLKNLQVEYQTNPLGIDVSQPRFNWQMESDRYGACGQAYRLWVADSPEQLAAGRYIYDSGKVLSGESVGVVYQGKHCNLPLAIIGKFPYGMNRERKLSPPSLRGSRPVFWVPDGVVPVGSARRRHNSPNIARIM